jgi:hypothetical protein
MLMDDYYYFLISLAIGMLLIHLTLEYPTIIFKKNEIN